MMIFKNSKRKFLVGIIIIAGIFFINLVCVDKKSNSNQNDQHIKTNKLEIIQNMYDGYKQKLFPGISDIRVKDLEKFTKAELLFVDIRDKQEQDVSMIPGAITQQEFENNIELYKNRIIIAYCTIGSRSGRYIKKLKQKDIQAYNLIGGILAWAWANEDLVNANGLTKKVHVYGPKWNLLPENYSAVF